MHKFMSDIAPTLWPEDKRISFCYMERSGEQEGGCNAKSGNPFGPFWDTFGIDFVGSEFYGPLNYDAHSTSMMSRWTQKYPSREWPVLAFTGKYNNIIAFKHGLDYKQHQQVLKYHEIFSGAPASFPVQNENRVLQKYLQWSENYDNKSNAFIKKNMNGGAFIGIHLRNGQDWVKACKHVQDSPTLFAAPQCVGYKSERGPLTLSMCFPQKSEIIKYVQSRAHQA